MNSKKTLNKIKELSLNLVAKIAAGEVVDRPASVVKELLDNALDAKAKNIQIKISQAGVKKINIIDDGVGMSPDDLRLCFKPHTTSKIKSLDDLENISSFGFRGEALASIAQVSQITIRSKTRKAKLGTEIKTQAAKLERIKPIGLPKGTNIIIDNLFYNTPARRKFLKSPQVEARKIINIVTKVALVNPQVAFSLEHNKKNIFNVPCQTQQERLKYLIGQDIYNELLPFQIKKPYFSLSGFIGRPQIASRTQKRQYFFANKRPFKSSTLAQTALNVCEPVLDDKAKPVVVLFLTLPPHSLDPNIHPQKKTLAFSNETEIVQAFEQIIQKTLEQHNLTYRIGSEEPFFLRDDFRANYTASFLRDKVEPWNLKDQNKKAILQVDKQYLVFENYKGLSLVDQHAAHERILYEQFLAEFKKNKFKPINLKQKIKLNLPQNEKEFLQANLKNFLALGFDIQKDKQRFSLKTIPRIFQGRNIKNLFYEILGNWLSGKGKDNLDMQSKKIISMLSCRTAIKAGDFLSEDERVKLIEKLKQTTSNYTCPHGRPAIITISTKELDKFFKRI